MVDSHSQIAKLGEGLQATGRLSDAAIERAMDALRSISRKLKAHGVGHVRCIATEACRRAENGADFIRRVQAETGLTFKVIGPKEEARLAAIGCFDLIAPDAGSVLVVDIGGGSTELSWVDARAAREGGLGGMLARPPIRDWTSLPLGVVTLTEAFAEHDEPTAWPAMLDHASKIVAGWSQISAVRAGLAADNGLLIGTSGTVTCLAGVHLGLDKYRRDKVDGAWMSHDEGQAAIDRIRLLGLDGRARLPTIGPERAGLMLAGCAIIEAVWRSVPGQRLRVADRGLREGLLLSMMYGARKPRRRRKRKPQTTPAGGTSE